MDGFFASVDFFDWFQKNCTALPIIWTEQGLMSPRYHG
jgi:hypothetical protein